MIAVQAFLPWAVVEGFDVSVVPRRPGRDVGDSDTTAGKTVAEQWKKLRTVVHPQHLRRSALQRECLVQLLGQPLLGRPLRCDRTFHDVEHRQSRRSERCVNGSSSSSKKPRSCAGHSPTSPGTSTQNDLPAGPRPCCRRSTRHSDLPGSRILNSSLRQMEEIASHTEGLGRCASDQHRSRNPRRRPRLRLPLHRRRTTRPRHHRGREQSRTTVLTRTTLVGVL